MPKTKTTLRRQKAQQNEHRRERAENALEAYSKELAGVNGIGPTITDPDTLTDLLTDLRHFCAHHRIDFGRSVNLSELNFESEK